MNASKGPAHVVVDGSNLATEGRSMPSLLPEGLEPEAHLSVALQTVHPMARPPVVPAHVAFAFDSQSSDPAMLVEHRRHVDTILDDMSGACALDSAAIGSACHPLINVNKTWPVLR